MKTKAVKEGTSTPEEQVAEDHEAVEATLAEEGVSEGPVRMEPILLSVRRQFKQNGTLVMDPEEEVEEIAIQGFEVEPAHVGLRINHTNNMGNFWSLSVQVSMEVPCYREEHAEAFEFVSKTIIERMGKEILAGAERVKGMDQNMRRGGPGSRQGGGDSNSGHPF